MGLRNNFLWSGVVRVPLAVKNRKVIGSGVNNGYNNTIRKRSQSREWYVYHFKGLKINIFKFMVNISMEQRDGWILVLKWYVYHPCQSNKKAGDVIQL